MANEESWFQRWNTKKRFWGSLAATVGGIALLIPVPIVQAVGAFLVKAGGLVGAIGVIDRADAIKKEKQAAKLESPDQIL